MKPQIVFIAVLIVFLFAGCNKTMYIYYGIHDPKNENFESEKQLLTKYKLPMDEIIVFKDVMGMQNYIESGLGLPNAVIFNSDGHYVSYATDSVDCSAGVGPFIESINRGAIHQADSTFLLASIFNDLVYSESHEPLNRSDLEMGYDYMIFIFWAGYTGRLNKVKVRKWYDTYLTTKTDEVKVRLYMVNADFQESWGLDDKDIPGL